jgi:GAF domain-containing protein
MTSPRSRASQERLERLLSAGLELTSVLSLDGVLHRVAELACEITGARYAAMGLLGPDGKSFQQFVTAGIGQAEYAAIGALPKGLGILGLVMREQETLRLEDLTKHPKAHGFPPKHPPMHSFLGVPIVGRRGVIGNLYITEKIEGERFTEEDESIARLMAAQAAAAVENARLHDESARLLEEVQQLHRSRERFFAMVNHELRNALAGTYGWAEMLVRRKDPASIPRAAFEVLDSAEQAVSLINDLLDLSRLDEDRLKPKIEEAVPGSGAGRCRAEGHRQGDTGGRSQACQPRIQTRGRHTHLCHRRAQGGTDPGKPADQCDPPHRTQHHRPDHACGLRRHLPGHGGR